jgi:PAS domain S-box-containing protein
MGMATANGLHAEVDNPLYNSRILKIFVEYVTKFYPQVDIDSILSYAGITKYELEDPAHWFSQHQVDHFHQILTQKTGDPDISRKAGRYAASSGGVGPLKQYTLGFMNIASIYLLMGKVYPMVSRGADVKAKKLGSNSVEIVSTPKPGVNEKPYQCENRIGTFESLPNLFTKSFAKIEHPSCFHKGDDCCRYIVTWEKSSSLVWKLVRNYSFLLSILASAVLFFILPIVTWIAFVLLCIIFTIIFSLCSEHIEKKELAKTIETQGDAAKNLLDEMNIRYNDALLIREIGQAISTILEIDKLVKTVTGIMEKHLDYDRGAIMLANKERTLLQHASGYGYTKEQEELLGRTGFHLDNPKSKGEFVLAFKEQEPFLISDIAEAKKNLSKKSQELAQQMGVQSLICVPIVYEKESLGILTVDNIKSKRSLTRSDMSLLMGVASQTGVSIINAMSFQKLQESEKKYRELVENANSIILRRDINGNITFFNEFAQKFFGYSEDEILGKNVRGTILPDTETTRRDLEELHSSLQQAPEQPHITQNENVLISGESVWIAWTYKPIFDPHGDFSEILCIGNDITELKRSEQDKKNLEARLQHAQRMEAIGTLAGGIAHDFNNILGAIIGYTEMTLYDAAESSQDLHYMDEVLKAGHRAKDLVSQILAFSRQTEQERKPIKINPILKEALTLLRASIPTTIEINQNIDNDVGTVNADPTQIHQVLMNLCTNAVHAMHEKGGTLEVTLSKVDMDTGLAGHPDIQPGTYLRLTVSDTGHGMDPHTMERVFDPYFTTKEKGLGTGLGLAVVHGIVKSHDGAVTFQSAPEKGTTFNVFLPSIKAEAKPESVQIETVCRGSENILFVDDEKPLAELGKQMLERLGYQVECKTSSIEALEVFRAYPHKFDLVITDMTMPNMTGEILARELMGIRPDIPVILCTGFSETTTEEKAKAMGVREFVMKPFEMNKLSKTIRKILG